MNAPGARVVATRKPDFGGLYPNLFVPGKVRLLSTCVDAGHPERTTKLRRWIPLGQIAEATSGDVGKWAPCVSSGTTGLAICQALLYEEVDMIHQDTGVAAEQDVEVMFMGVVEEAVVTAVLNYHASTALTIKQVMEDLGFGRYCEKASSGTYARPSAGTPAAGNVLIGNYGKILFGRGATVGNN
jgi:hypothetical protein